MVVNFDFMAIDPTGQTYNISKIKFFGDRIELELLHPCDHLDNIFTEKKHKNIYLDNREDDCILYRKNNNDWVAVNKKRKDFDYIYENL
jgi:hypothetical protein